MIATFVRWLGSLIDPNHEALWPESDKEVTWEEYTERLLPEDQENVLAVLRRFNDFARTHAMPLGVMAVGSVLYKPFGEYRDVDLVILPLREEHLHSAESQLAAFITAQPEILCERKSRKPLEGHWEGFHCYDLNRYWDLVFPAGKHIQLFIGTRSRRRTLRQQIEAETTLKDYSDRPFACLILDPLAK